MSDEIIENTVVIGGATGAWGDSSLAGAQLLASGRCDYIIFEALAEITMGILTRARRKDPSRGYATDIIEMIGRDIAAYRKACVRVITNAGGMHPAAAAARLREIAESVGQPLKIATVAGDDLTSRLGELRDAGAEVPSDALSASVYLGARPIAAALDAGADVVITGRCVDSALVLGPLIHEHGWSVDDRDALSQGSLAGHLLECGPQSTGGLLTDWRDIASFEDIGFPIAECRADGTFVLTKPDGTGGIVDERSVSEQLIYEIGDPASYLLPDVTCDWRNVTMSVVGDDRVLVTGARGRPPPPTLKACAQIADGFKVKLMLFVAGRDAVAKAERLGGDMLKRAARVLERDAHAPLRAHDIEVLGAESTYGPHARADRAREVVLKVGLHHDDRVALDSVVRELPSFGLAAVGVTGGGTGLARSTPLLRLACFDVPRELVAPVIALDGEIAYAEPPVETEVPAPSQHDAADAYEVTDPVRVPLIAIAHGRSGDKGADANIGVRARHPDFFPLLAAHLTADVVRRHLLHRVAGGVERYALPGLDAFNFVLRDALGGGGIASLRMDAQGKAHAQQLLDMPIAVPRAWLSHPAFRDPEPRSEHPRGFDWTRLQSATPGDPLRVLFSACLLGNATGWDGEAYTEQLAVRLAGLDCVRAIPFCPEDVSLGTPRPLTTLYDGHGRDVLAGRARVLETTMRDVTKELVGGAHAMLAAAQKADAELAVMLDVSDSCGSHAIYIGHPEDRRYQQGPGVAAALLARAGIPIVAQRDYATLQRIVAALDPSFVPDPDAIDFVDHPWFVDYFQDGPVGLKLEDYERNEER